MKWSISMKKAFLLFSMILVFYATSFAQFSVKGTIVDKKTSETLPFVNVALLRPSDSLFMRGASTSYDGKFNITDVDSGAYILQVHSVGYNPLIQSITINGNTQLNTLALTQGTLLKEVEIVGNKPLYAMDGEKNMYNVSDDPSIQTGTASDALQNAPDVEVDVEGNIKLRGTPEVEVWINDQPSHLNSESLKQYIKTLPANAIERIEVITNPSARYKNQSGGGIINIITNQKVKRNEFISFGLNGSVKPNLSPWVSYVYANEKLNLNLYLSGNWSGSHGFSESKSTMLRPDSTISQVEQKWDTSNYRHLGTYLNFSISYQIDSMSSISGWMSLYPSWNKSRTITRTERNEYDYLGNINTFTGSSLYHSKDEYMGGYIGAWYEHRFNTLGKKIALNINGSMSESGSMLTFNRLFKPFSSLNVEEKKETYDPELNGNIGVYYTLPYSKKGEFELGIDGSSYNSASHRDVELKDSITQKFMVDDSMSSALVNNYQNIDAYVTWLHRIQNFTIKAGLRAEYSHNGVQYPDDSTCNKSLSSIVFVPSLHLSYRTKSMHNFNLSFSRRAQQPKANQLTEYIIYNLDSYSIGNPDLLPSYTNKIEGGWSKYFNKFGSISINGYYTNRTNMQSSLSDVVYRDYYGRMISFSKPINIGDSRNLGVSFNITYRPTGFFNIRLNAHVYNNYFNMEYRPNEWIEKSMTSYSINLHVWAKLFNKLEVFADGNYSSKSQSLFSVTKPYKGINLGLSAEFFDRKLSAYINVNDIFNWNVYRYENTNPYYQTSSSSKYTSRYISAGITLRFGKMELESYARQGATETEVKK